MLLHLASVLTLVAGFILGRSEASLPLNTAEVSGYQKLKSWKTSSLYRVEADADYTYNPLLIHLVGSRYDIGYAYSYMLSEEISHNYHSLLNSLLGTNLEAKALEAVLAQALDWQWNDYLSKELPVVYRRELEGVADGGVAASCADCGKFISRAITLANAPGDVQDFLLILVREFLEKTQPSLADGKMQLVNKWAAAMRGRETFNMHCSMFAAWGDRTVDGELFAARNLDWNKDTGVNKYKVIMVTVPDDGAIPSVQLNYAGLYGPLAGMSAEGITVHEANLEEEAISFEGFPWVLRLRYIMEYARDLPTARQLWESTNNTVGFNHMIASGNDAALYRQGKTKQVAMALETMYQYTAYFYDNDTREAAAMYSPSDASGAVVHIGAPLPEAVWRTNHGYDPKIRAKYEWSQSPTSWSVVRYMFVHDTFQYYNSTGTKIGLLQALNLTAVVGDKGKHAQTCLDNTDGTNVLSVTYLPEKQTMYTAWERGSGDSWRPAVCSSYIKLNLTDWFTPSGPHLIS